MKYLPLDQTTLHVIDDFFNSKFAYSQITEITPELYFIFPWTHDFNSDDLQIIFEDLQKEIYLDNYVPKKYLKSAITFLNFILKQIPNLSTYYLKPNTTVGYFRTYYLEYR